MTADEVKIPKRFPYMRKGLENQLFNVAKKYRGRMIPRPYQIPLLTGPNNWYVTRIFSLRWVNPETLIVVGSLALESENTDDEKSHPVTLRVDTENRTVSGEMKVGVNTVGLSPETLRYYRWFSEA